MIFCSKKNGGTQNVSPQNTNGLADIVLSLFQSTQNCYNILMLITRNPIYIFLKESCFKVIIFSFETEISTRVKKFEIEISLKRLLQ